MTRRTILPLAVLFALVAALACALLAPTPSDGLPAVALGSTIVWRVEVAAIVFTAAYGAIVTIRLALHGHTYTRVGSSGIDIPQIGREQTQTHNERVAHVEALLDELQSSVTGFGDRLDALEDPSHLLLKRDDQET